MQLNLSESQPRIVIEGSFSDKYDFHHVKISKSIGFYDTTAFPAVEGAKVVLTDNEGLNQELYEYAPGDYVTPYIRGKRGNTYTLTVTVEGQTYSSSSFMPPSIKADTVYVTEENFDWWENKIRGYRMYCEFIDPEEKGTYLMLRANINRNPQGEIFLFSDEYVNSSSIKYKFREIDIYKGNKVFVDIWSIDEQAYKYFKSLRNVVVDDEGGGRASPLGMMPANPQGNFTNGALGFFVAYSLKRTNKAIAE